MREENRSSLQDKAWERAINRHVPKVASPYDWEEFEKLKKLLKAQEEK